MRDIKITLAQTILNKANSKQEFTTVLNDNAGRYVVAHKNLYLGSNPSNRFDLIERISDTVDNNEHHSIGGWIDQDTGNYWLDANIHYNNFTLAIETARHLGEIAIYDTIDNKVIITNDH
jgi:hypothetical protein